MAEQTAALEAIEAKIEKGEALTPEEQKIIDDGPGGAEESAKKDEEEVIDPEKVTVKKDEPAKKDEKVSKAADTPAEKGAEADKAKKEKAAEETGAIDPEKKKLIEAEAEKPLDEANIESYSPRERALFFELKGERRKRQDAQLEADTLKFQRAKEQARLQQERERIAAEEKAKAEKEKDPFDGIDDDELLTAGQIKKLLSGKTKETVKETPVNQEAMKRAERLQYENWTLKAQSKIPEILEVMKFADVLLKNDKIAEAEVGDVVDRGGNPMIATYNYLKASPHWPAIEAKLKGSSAKTDDEKAKEEEARVNKERAERIKNNEKKTVTTGSGGGAPATGDYTIQELLDMPEEEFGKLPKSQRDRILEAF